jgi:hypothetical protein
MPTASRFWCGAATSQDGVFSEPGDLLPAAYATLVSSYPTAKRDEGPALARGAIEEYAGAAEADTCELIVTHNS